jgi:GDPmannose 4,6-dehydratase
MIARAAALAFLGKPEDLAIQDLDAIVDWGDARDYVRAMWLILQQPAGGEYVVSSGTGHTVRDFARHAFDTIGMDFRSYVRSDSETRSSIGPALIGDNAKLRRACGWEPALSFEQMVEQMVFAQIAKLERTPA